VIKDKQIIVNNFNKFAFIIEGAALIAKIICYYTIVKDVYLGSPS